MMRHEVVIARLPAGVTTAAKVASHILRRFKSIKLKPMVGNGCGMPTGEKYIRLVDVVVG